MNNYILSYDVNVSGSGSYDKFYDYLGRRGEKNYLELTESTYLIRSNYAIEDFMEVMRGLFDEEDVVYVVVAEDKGKLGVNRLY